MQLTAAGRLPALCCREQKSEVGKTKVNKFSPLSTSRGGGTVVVSGVEGHGSLRHDPAGIHCKLWDLFKDVVHVYRCVFTCCLHSSGDRKHQQSISDYVLNARC